MLVISLPYSKAPAAPFPAALHDLEVLYLAVLADESLPISRASTTTTSTTMRGGQDKGQVAILGFNAGGNLALGLSQLPRIREQHGAKKTTTTPTAVVSISGYLDLGRTAAQKLQNRPYRPAPSPPTNHTNLNNNNGGAGIMDALAATHEAYVWSYVPYGTDLQDPLLSPAFASWDDEDGERALPAHVCLVGAELDMLAHESWRMACRLVRDGGVRRGDGRWGRWRVPDPDADDVVQSVCGRAEEDKAGMPAGGDAAAAGEAQGSEQMEMSILPPPERIGDGPREDEGRQTREEGEDEDDGLTAAKRFGFEVCWRETAEEERGSVKWILVPDVLHGFDRASWRTGGGNPDIVRDAEEKTRAYVDAVGAWLRGTVWGM